MNHDESLKADLTSKINSSVIQS